MLSTEIHEEPITCYWDRLAVAPTGSEVAQAAAVEADLPLGEELMGVYATAGGERKAWLVHKKSEWDPKGTIMIIR